ncbi:MAG TPA: TIGR03435 family protein [Terriglobales bacterium]|nr:TIGR03435 family protein [Terriglobales bacterium]
MTISRLAVFLVALSTFTLPAQTTTSSKGQAPAGSVEPLIVDVHPAPYHAGFYHDSNISDQRYDLRNATMLDMIAIAYDRKRDDATIVGGPTWLELDRFNLAAKIDSLKAPKATATSNPNPNAANAANNAPNPYDAIRPMMKAMLTQRFHLKFHTEERPLPGYVITIAKSGVRLTETKLPSDSPNCRGIQDKDTPGVYGISCTSMTMAQFVDNYGGIYTHKVVDKTGLTKSYDFTFRLKAGDIRTREEYVRVYTDAFRNQLGLQITEANVPQPAMVIDGVDRAPTPNAPEIAKLIPPLPDLEFEVASIRPSADKDPQGMIRPTGSQITFSGFLLQELIGRAWDLPTAATLGNALDSMPKQRYTVMVKLPPDIDARAVWQDQDEVNRMMQKLLIDRFQIKYHWGDQMRTGYVLLPGTPRMKKADPNSRSFCKFGAPLGEKDMATADSIYDREFHCQNVTMDQFVDLLQSVAGAEIKTRVPNRTGLAGAYDFSVYFTTGHKMRVDAQSASAAAKQTDQSAATSAEPSGAVLIDEAFRKQLGIRLEQQQLMLPTLVLDHFEQKPTEN